MILITVIGSAVDFVDEYFLLFGHFDGAIQADQQLLECFAVAANQHGNALIIVVGCCRAMNRPDSTDSNGTVTVDQELDVRQRRKALAHDL